MRVLAPTSLGRMPWDSCSFRVRFAFVLLHSDDSLDAMVGLEWGDEPPAGLRRWLRWSHISEKDEEYVGGLSSCFETPASAESPNFGGL